jgi:chorismate mutase/prephenate dehydratase
VPQLAGGHGQGRDVQPAPARAAAELAAKQPGVAAIGSALAGELYGLHVLFENIEDNPDNVTRFFVIGREGARASGDDKTAIMFTTAHKPGALAEVLDVFKENGINLTDIEKRPSKKVNWEYYFLHRRPGTQDDAGMKKRSKRRSSIVLQLTVLGSYPRATEVDVSQGEGNYRAGCAGAESVYRAECGRGFGGGGAADGIAGE